jgi:hypothetical protein
MAFGTYLTLFIKSLPVILPIRPVLTLSSNIDLALVAKLVLEQQIVVPGKELRVFTVAMESAAYSLLSFFMLAPPIYSLPNPVYS